MLKSLLYINFLMAEIQLKYELQQSPLLSTCYFDAFAIFCYKLPTILITKILA